MLYNNPGAQAQLMLNKMGAEVFVAPGSAPLFVADAPPHALLEWVFVVRSNVAATLRFAGLLQGSLSDGFVLASASAVMFKFEINVIFRHTAVSRQPCIFGFLTARADRGSPASMAALAQRCRAHPSRRLSCTRA